MNASELNELIAKAEKYLENELEKGLEIVREIQEELEREPLDAIEMMK